MSIQICWHSNLPLSLLTLAAWQQRGATLLGAWPSGLLEALAWQTPADQEFDFAVAAAALLSRQSDQDSPALATTSYQSLIEFCLAADLPQFNFAKQVEQLESRGKMFRGFVEVQLPGALYALGQRWKIETPLVVDVHLIWPSRGGLALPLPGFAASKHATVMCEAVLTDIVIELPEITRLLWAIAASIGWRQDGARSSHVWNAAIEDVMEIAVDLDLFSPFTDPTGLKSQIQTQWLAPAASLLGTVQT